MFFDKKHVRSHIVIAQLAKAPEPGKVKTRMQPYLSAEQASDLHCLLTERVAENMAAANAGTYALWVSAKAPFFERIEQGYNAQLHQQCDGNLGARLADISRFYLGCKDGENPNTKLMIIGSDCPFLTADIIDQCQQYLIEYELVIIPATDGGYVCIAQKAHHPSLFENIDWGSERVLMQTLAAAKQSKLNVKVLDALADIDRPEDLALLNKLPDWKM